MTKCAGCRVRHLNCDTYATCTECKKSGRECVRLHVRFRNLVCPSKSITRAEYSRYEYFFDDEQTWIDTSGKLEFVFESDCTIDASPAEELEHPFFDIDDMDAGPRPALVEQTLSTFVLGSSSHPPAFLASVVEHNPPDYLAASAQVPEKSPSSVASDQASGILAQSLRKASHNGEPMPYDAGVSLERLIPVPEPAWPLKSLQEGKLLQHFVTHLAPWVSSNVFPVPWTLADSDSSSTSAIASGTLARLRLAWQRQIPYS